MKYALVRESHCVCVLHYKILTLKLCSLLNIKEPMLSMYLLASGIFLQIKLQMRSGTCCTLGMSTSCS